MKKRLLIIILPITFLLISAIVILGIDIFRNHPSILNYDETSALYPEERMLEFDETYYFNGTEIKEDMETGTVWRVDYNGHVSAFKFVGGSDWVDYAEFILSPEDTQTIWELADSLEGDFVPSGYEGYAYGSILYKYTDKGEKSLKKFSGLSDDYPSTKGILSILSENYKTVLDNSNEESANSFDWEQYKGSMDERQFSSLSKYISLFEEDKPFYYYQIEKECSLSDLKESFEIDNYTVQNFTLVDMNDDGEEELIANFDLGPGLTFVFTIIDEKYYGSFFSAREMRELQANGNFSASGGAADTYFCKLYISKEKMESVSWAEKHGWGEECNWTEQEYEDFIKENYSNPAKFWDLNIQID